MKRLVFILVLSLGMFFAALPETAGAAETKILDTTITKYEEAARNWEPAMRVAAKRLFLILCAISLVFTFGYAFVQGNMGIGDFFSEFIKFGITMGFFFWCARCIRCR